MDKKFKLLFILLFYLLLNKINFKLINKKKTKNIAENNNIFNGRIFLWILYNNETEFAYIHI